MVEFIIHTIFWTLAIYGLFEIIKNIIYINTCTKFQPDGIYLIIAVKNQEDKIEGFLRSSLFRILYGKEEYLKNRMDVFNSSKIFLDKSSKWDETNLRNRQNIMVNMLINNKYSE